MSEAVVLLGCGDVGPIHEPMARYSELVRDTLAGADIRFAQVERVYSGELNPVGGTHGRPAPHMASVITDCNPLINEALRDRFEREAAPKSMAYTIRPLTATE